MSGEIGQLLAVFRQNLGEGEQGARRGGDSQEHDHAI